MGIGAALRSAGGGQQDSDKAEAGGGQQDSDKAEVHSSKYICYNIVRRGILLYEGLF